MRRPGTSFADKDSVQRLARDALAGLPHVATFSLPAGAAGGAARRAVLDFVAKEGVDLLVVGMYKGAGAARRKGLARRGSAAAIYNRCGCPVLVVPMSEAALVAAVKAAELEAADAEEAELESGSSDSGSDGEPAEDAEAEAASPSSSAFAGGLPHPRALMGSIADALSFGKRRQSGLNEPGGGAAGGGAQSPRAAAARQQALSFPGGGGLAPGRYLLEVDAAGAVRAINPLPPGGEGASEGGAAPAAAVEGGKRRSSAGCAGSSSIGGSGGGGGNGGGSGAGSEQAPDAGASSASAARELRYVVASVGFNGQLRVHELFGRR